MKEFFEIRRVKDVFGMVALNPLRFFVCTIPGVYCTMIFNPHFTARCVPRDGGTSRGDQLPVLFLFDHGKERETRPILTQMPQMRAGILPHGSGG
jgi:hypothetical protein